MASHAEKNETKPRLAKDEVEILENHFRACNKPNSQVKRQLAEQFGVEPARINNWFQNRRAKAKQERKQLDYDLRQAGDLTYSRPQSPDDYREETYDDQFEAPLEQSLQLPILSGPPPAPVASYHPRYENPSAASMHSLQRTIQEAEAAAHRGDFDEYQTQAIDASFSEAFFTPTFPTGDHAHFSATTSAPSLAYDERTYHDESAQPMTASTRQNFFIDAPPEEGRGDAMRRPFPSQMFGHDGFPATTYQSHVLMPVQPLNEVASQEGNDMRFKSPPPPTDLAGRRSKPRPAALGTTSLREHINIGPRSVSSNDVPKRLNYSPLGSPMRRIQSNGGGLNVIGGRIQKIGPPQRSPLVKTFATNCDVYFQDPAQCLIQMPHTAGASFNQEFPPTPSSPYAKTHVSRSISDASSPGGSEPSYILNHGGFDLTEEISNIASPPETPHNPLASSQWAFDVPDEPLHTPSFGIFGPEASMPIAQPQYVSPLSAGMSVSQPATPALDGFNGYLYQSTSSHYDFPVEQQGVEYHFPDGPGLPYGLSVSTGSSPNSHAGAKNYTFSNLTPETLKEQQKRMDEREKTPVARARV
ncbi:MAG: hypothetical protein M1818_005322 [Claussenomyces sp. TS43310]|nr:MAG: hypothetical protein M1818_005322 [Claussenomyces sp. TS43310]